MLKKAVILALVTTLLLGFALPVQAESDDTLVLVAFEGNLIPATEAKQMKATAYTAGYESTGKHRGHPAFGITYSGTRVQEGRTIAVDPEVIPIGTWVYIEDMGLYRAEDTGGKIKGSRIDIYMQNVDEALEFGVQEVNVYLIETDHEKQVNA